MENLDWKIATAQVKRLHAISTLAQYIQYYIRGIRHVYEGGNLEIRDRYSFDFPPIESRYQWTAFLTVFWDDTKSLAEAIEGMSEEKLDQCFVDEKYGTYERNILGLIEHGYYHLGQIVLIKKLLEDNP